MTPEAVNLLTLTANHTRHLRRLAGEPLTPVPLLTASKPIMQATLQAAEIELLQTIALISPSDYDSLPVCGFWTIHDLIGHLADWDKYFVNWLAIMTNKPQKDLYWDEDGDRFNAWFAINDEARPGRRHGQIFARIVSVFSKAWQQFLTNNFFVKKKVCLFHPFIIVLGQLWSIIWIMRPACDANLSI